MVLDCSQWRYHTDVDERQLFYCQLEIHWLICGRCAQNFFRPATFRRSNSSLACASQAESDYSLFLRAWDVVRNNTGGAAPAPLAREELLKIGTSPGEPEERTVAKQMQLSWARWARKNEQGIIAFSAQ